EEVVNPCARGFSYFSQADAEAKYDASGWDYGFWNYTVEAWAKHTMNWTLLRQMTTIKPSVGRKVCFFNSGSGVLDSYFLGDAVAAGTFDANGDAGIVEGIGSTTLRLARTSNYPGDLAAGGYFPVTNTSRPTWPVSGTERGYKLPLKSDGDCVLTVQHIYKPVFTNA
ncbi:MAG: hypothetical protein M0R06_25650, partial [Sphaerochaeta sp.]|nr:hypothetical protein [Sphaerochaeta sp.]